MVFPYPLGMSVTGPGDPLPTSRVLSHLAVMGAVSVVMGVIAAGLAIPLAGVLGIGARDMSNSLDNLPAELQTEALPQKTRILDGNGRLIASLYDENRVNVQLKDVSRTMVKAIVSIEDYRFYKHGALDIKGTLRALITNQASDGVVQGGSSITQQMVKLTLLQQADTPEERKAATDDTYARKLRELRYAIAFEKKYSKDWILERYLNIAYFGDGAFGVQSAARHYFDKNASKLGLRESAMLAGLVKNPTGYDPTNYPDRTLDRRNLVIDRMAELNVITPAKANKTKARPLGLDIKKTKNGCVNSRAPFFCDYVINYLLHDEQLGKTPRERKEFLYSAGLTINTTVDMRFQKAADSSVASHVYATDEAIGGLAEIEPGSGNVKALAQSRPMGRDAKNGQTYLNYVVPKEYGDANGFQAGSTFKAFVLSAAIEQDIPLNHAINSPPSMVLNESDYEDCDHEPYGYGTWPVGNSTSSGTMNLYTGTRLSVNTFFAQLEQETGICQPFNLARKMGVRLTQPLPNKQRLRWRAHPLIHAGRRRREPPGDGRGLRHLRGPRAALRRASRDLDPGLEPQDAQEVPQGLPAGAAEPGRRRRQRRPARGAGGRRFRCLRGAGPRQAVSWEDGHHQLTTRPSGSWATPRTSRPHR